jgi:hypothetical protein
MSVQDIGSGAPPPRPATVPPDAAWSVENGEWELAPRDADGRRDGVVRAWRADGTLAAETGFRAGEREGAWRRFHPDGAVAREGRYEGGQAHGRMIAHGTDAPTTEPLQSCCVPPGAWELQHDYDRGHLTDIRWYDRAGVHILPSGAPHPARPAGLPPEARFEEGRDQWTVTAYDDNGQPHGVWKRWARDGVLRERDEYAAGKADGLWQRWGETGALEEESVWRAGQRGGAYRRVGVPPELFTDPRITEERGAFERDQPVGAWTLLDAKGAVICARPLGAALDDAGLLASPALADEGTKDWAALADRLAAEDRPAEALLAAARAAAAARDAAPLRERLARLALPRQPESALGLAATLVARDGGGLSMIANGLPAGADAASLLRAMASLLDGRDRVALELVDAALLLSPDRADCHVTRALVSVHLGRPESALADVRALPEDHVEQREFLTGYVRVIFPAFSFAPATEPAIETHFTDVPDAVDQPLEKVVAAIQKYATRLGVLRAAVASRLPEGEAPAWLPPALPELLPNGPVALETWDFEEIVEPEEDDPSAADGEPEPHPVVVDERITVDDTASLPALMRQARRDWVGLCWLCWAAGLDRVALPDALEPPDQLGAAAGMSIERLWRCRDKLITGGLRAMTQGVPGFVWEGIEIDLLPAVLAEIAADEYREMRAIFFWLCDQGVQSVWQDNLRAAD